MATLRRPNEGSVDASGLRELLARQCERSAAGSENSIYGRPLLAEAVRLRSGAEVVVAAWKIPEPLRQGFGIDNPWNLVLGEDGRLRPWRGRAEQ